MARYVAHGGHAILSGILTTQADEVAAAYAAGGLALERRDDFGDWSTLVVKRA
jgi:ribosomal protein L11 methyltransferase